jgi:hypothetical protein
MLLINNKILNFGNFGSKKKFIGLNIFFLNVDINFYNPKNGDGKKFGVGGWLNTSSMYFIS